MTQMIRCIAPSILLILLFGCDNQRGKAEPQPQAREQAAGAAQSVPLAPPPVVETGTSDQDPSPTPAAVPILTRPAQAAIVEMPTDALPVWRQFRDRRPILVLLSDDPFLQAIPTDLWEDGRNLAQTASPAQIRSMTAPFSSAPVLLPTMALSAALATDLLAEIVWVLPTRKTPDEFTLPVFVQQLQELGAISQKEAASFSRRGETYIGRVRETPLRIAFPGHLPQLSGTVLLHIDLSYFAPFYQNEVSTPLFPIILHTLADLQQTRWPVSATTVSLSNLSGAVPLDSRFLQEVFAEIFHNPAIMLGDPLPNWQRQKDIFYVKNLFQYDKALELALAMEEQAPEDAAVHYVLYKTYRLLKKSRESLAHLDKAVALDPVFALEYLSLAPVATERGRPDEAARLLALAAAALPEHAFIPVDRLHALLQTGEHLQALQLLDGLQQADWSPVYYPTLPKTLRQYREALTKPH